MEESGGRKFRIVYIEGRILISEIFYGEDVVYYRLRDPFDEFLIIGMGFSEEEAFQDVASQIREIFNDDKGRVIWHRRN